MAIASYPRTAIQGTPATNNKQNGLSLMVLNPSTGQYEAATAATFAGGGGGGGDATAANQSQQIAEAQVTNQYLFDVGAGLSAAQLLETIRNNTYSNDASRSVAQLLFSTGSSQSVANMLESIQSILTSMTDILTDIRTYQTDGSARVVIQDTGGNLVNVSSNRLNVDTGA